MWVGQQLADGLDFWGFLGSLILGGIILGIYTGLLGYVGAKTGLSLDSHVLQRTENLVPSPRLWLSLSEIP